VSSRAGFTLIEVILALALSSVVLALVSTSIDVHLRVLDAGRTQVEEARLARAVLERIADDLRGIVQPFPEEEDSPETEPDESEPTDPESLDPEAAESDPADLEDVDPESAALESIDLTQSDIPQPTPGLCGNAYQLRIDTSRLPRADQFVVAEVASSDLEAQPPGPISDVKTVTYYVNNEPTAEATDTTEPVTGGAGLVRHEQDRATALWTSEDMALDPSVSAAVPLASEVAAIEFLYHDGLDWVEEWDSAQEGGLPKAVKIAVWIIPVKLRDQDRSTLTETDCMVYRLTVHLSTAEEGGP